MKPITPKSKNSPIWSHFKVYPNLPAMSADSKQNMWHEFAVCVHCYEKYHTNKSILSSTIWEVKYGTSHSTSKLSAHLQRKHKSAYRSLCLLKVAVNKANDAENVNEEDESIASPINSVTNNSSNKRPATNALIQSRLPQHFANKQVYHEQHIKWIVMNFKAIDESADKYYRAMISAINPNVHHFSRQTVLERLL